MRLILKRRNEYTVIADECSTSTDSQDLMKKDVEEKKEVHVYGIGEAAEANGNYYSKFVNVSPDLIFKFTAEKAQKGALVQ